MMLLRYHTSSFDSNILPSIICKVKITVPLSLMSHKHLSTKAPKFLTLELDTEKGPQHMLEPFVVLVTGMQWQAHEP